MDIFSAPHCFDLPAHPLAGLFPMLSDAEIAELADDICTYGQRVPIMVLDGQVLDGRNRLAACKFAEIEPSFELYEGDDPLAFVLSHNLHRRHLTASQRAMVAAQIVDWETGINQHTAGSANLQTREAARRLSISERAVAAAKRIHDRGSAELVAAIHDGRVSVHAGEAISELEHAAQAEVLRAEEREIKRRAKEIRARQQRERHAVRLTHMDMVATKGQVTAHAWWKDDAGGPTFPVIYADPAWKFKVHSEVTGREKSAENHYPTMDLSEILALGCPAARDAVLFLWVTDLANGLACMAAWGFTYKSFWAWNKVYPGEQTGTGYWSFDNVELLLIGTRGNPPAPLPGTQPLKCTAHPVGRHSEKPLWFIEQISRLYPGMPRLEMFSRSAQPGWETWGFEAATGKAVAE